jgi:predicted acyl esterase
MVHVQSTWFPLNDRNPQQILDIYSARESDFIKATQRLYRSRRDPSYITLYQLK